MDLVTEIWRPYIREPDGGISRRYYELCTLWQLRGPARREYLGHAEPPLC